MSSSSQYVSRSTSENTVDEEKTGGEDDDVVSADPPDDSPDVSAESTESSADMLEFDRCSNGEELELDDVFNLLKNQRRRWVIQYLKNEGGSSTLNDLAETIAAKENGIDKSMLSSSQRKRVYIGLYQCHLPKMDDLGVIEYDKNRGTIELQDVSQLEVYLGKETDEDEPPRYDHAVGSFIGVAVLVGLTNVGPTAILPASLWGTLGAVTLLAMIGIQRKQR